MDDAWDDVSLSGRAAVMEIATGGGTINRGRLITSAPTRAVAAGRDAPVGFGVLVALSFATESFATESFAGVSFAERLTRSVFGVAGCCFGRAAGA